MRRATEPRVKNGPPLAGHGAEAVRDAIAATITTIRLLVYLPYGWSPARLESRCPAGALAIRLSTLIVGETHIWHAAPSFTVGWGEAQEGSAQLEVALPSSPVTRGPGLAWG